MLYQDTMTFKQDTSKWALLFSFKITVFVGYDVLIITPLLILISTVILVCVDKLYSLEIIYAFYCKYK